MKPNRVKATLAAGGVSVGTFVFEFATTGIARLAAGAGAEFALFDMEHTGWTVEIVQPDCPSNGALFTRRAAV